MSRTARTRGSVSVTVPVGTPDEVLEALLDIAEAVGDPADYSLSKLVISVREFIRRPDPQHEQAMARLDAIESSMKRDS